MKLLVVFLGLFGLVSTLGTPSTHAAPAVVRTPEVCTRSYEPEPSSLVCWQNANGASCCCFQTLTGLFCQGGGCLSTP